MPALIDDPSSPPISLQSLRPSHSAPPQLTPMTQPLRSSSTTTTTTSTSTTNTPVCTLLPFSSGPSSVPPRLIDTLWRLLSREIEAGDTYPMLEALGRDAFASYWFAGTAVVAIRGGEEEVRAMLGRERKGREVWEGEGKGEEEEEKEGVKEREEVDWEKVCLGTFYIKPNYPGRSSHICNAGFLVHESARGQGVGRILGEAYLKWAPQLGYIYSVFNLVYVSNVASCRLWDSLGFDRIGRVPGCGLLKGHDELVDAIQYGRHLVPREEVVRRMAERAGEGKAGVEGNETVDVQGTAVAGV